MKRDSREGKANSPSPPLSYLMCTQGEIYQERQGFVGGAVALISQFVSSRGTDRSESTGCLSSTINKMESGHARLKDKFRETKRNRRAILRLKARSANAAKESETASALVHRKSSARRDILYTFRAGVIHVDFGSAGTKPVDHVASSRTLHN